MMTYIYHFTASGLEGFSICCILSILRESYWDMRKIVPIVVILAGSATILDEWNIEINVGINLMMISALIKIFYRRKVVDSIFDTVCSAMIFITIEMLFTACLCKIDPQFTENRTGMIIYLSGLATGFFLLYKLTRKQKAVQSYYAKYRNGIWIICLNFILIQLAEMYNWNQTDTIDISIIVLVLAAVASNMLLAFKLIKNQQQKEELNRQKELMELKEGFLQQMAAEQHDFAKHLRTIRALLLKEAEGKESVSEAEAYVEELIASRSGQKGTVYTGDGVLSAILQDKQQEAEQKGISFCVLARDMSARLPLSQIEMVELVGNLLDNAFEAVEGLEPDRRKVLFETGEQKGEVFFQTINSLPEDSLGSEQMLKKGVSTKNGKLRGYGLSNIKRIAEEHGGRVEIQKNEEIVVIRVLFQ